MSTYSKEEQAENRQKWAAALRSGDYKQAQGALRAYVGAEREDVGYCCLGVACDLAEKAGIVKRVQGSYGPLDNFYDDNRSTALPSIVSDWLGVSTDGEITERIEYRADWNERGIESTSTLIGLNDSANWTFEQIADLIEAGKVETQ